jgi:Skp family chaperone for outer membrane proteins
MRKLHLMTLATVGLAASTWWLLSPGQAQPAPAARAVVAVVNVPVVFRDSESIKASRKDVEERAKHIKADAEAQQKTLIDREKSIRDKFNPESKDYGDQMRELLTERIRHRVELEERGIDLQLEQQRVTTAFYGKINKCVEDCARENGYEVVLYTEDFEFNKALSLEDLLAMIRQHRVMYSRVGADITREVIKRLDAMASAPSAPVPAPASGPVKTN